MKLTLYHNSDMTTAQVVTVQATGKTHKICTRWAKNRTVMTMNNFSTAHGGHVKFHLS